jgi:hypothetical protein
LGANTYKVQTLDGRIVWAMSSKKYIEEATRVVEQLLKDDRTTLWEVNGFKVPKRNGNVQGMKSPMQPQGYCPELDNTKELDEGSHSRYQQLIGILRWAIELGRIDIYFEVSILS